MKTTPGQRQFALPVVIVASAHAFLFFGFVAPPKNLPGSPAKPKTEYREIPFNVPEDPVVSADSEDPSASSKETRGGQPLPDLPDMAILNPQSDFTVAIDHLPIQNVNTPIASIPTQPIGDSTATHHQRILSASELDFIPHTTSQLAPIYPARLRVAGISGQVMVSFIVDPRGRVTNAQVLSATHPDFIAPALRAVSCWRFQPGKHEGRPVSFRMSVPLSFVLGAEYK